jgi:hypothetical protein
MSHSVAEELSEVLEKIDRPGSFCVSGGAPTVLPGLEVEGLGPIGLPLTARQAKELKSRCEQAPYGKGEETLVDTSVRNVWRMKPEHFTLTNPDWEKFLRQTVKRVQEELGLEKQKLESHLYELLLYEPGSFFLPHRDGEKLDRMVATLVLVLPSSYQGGELVVRHEGQEQTIDFTGQDSPFAIHYAAFYADCEHEIRPLRKGYRLCLVYNLTLAKSKKAIRAPRTSEAVEEIARALRKWAEDDGPQKLAVTLEHQYTQEGLTWDALKGVDRARARALLEGARQADCHAYLALLTLHESGSAVDDGGYGYGYGRRRRWYEEEEEEEEDSGEHEFDEIFETELTAEHWIDPEGKRLPISTLSVEEDDVLDPDALRDIEPEEDFEGYTGNAGMTLDRWYRHAAIFLWPSKRHFQVLCDAGTHDAAQALGQLVKKWRKAGKKEAAALRAQCVDFAAAIIARWPENPYGGGFGVIPERSPLFPSLVALDEPGLVKTYLGEVLPKDAAADPGKSLATVCKKHGWAAFRPELEAAFKQTTSQTLERNVRLLEHLCLATPKKGEGTELCQVLARSLVEALERIDQEAARYDWRARNVDRGKELAALARSLLATGQDELLSRLVDHALARPEKYPLTTVHMGALTALEPWLKKNVKEPSDGLSHWLAACREQLEALTAQTPQPPADFRRDAEISCKCADCAELKRFLKDPAEPVHHFRAAEPRRQHLESNIRQHHIDLDLRTERRGSPYTLVCTKNQASYEAKLKKFHEDQEHLATVRAIEKSVPK